MREGAGLEKPNHYSRRDFLKVSTSALALGLTSPEIVLADSLMDDDLDFEEVNSDGFTSSSKALGPEARVRRHGFSILQGLTTQDSTQLTIDVPCDLDLTYRLLDYETAEEQDLYYSRSVRRDFSKWRVDKLGYDGLQYPRRYIFQVVDVNGEILDERYLNTLDLDRQDVRICFLSCMLDWSVVKKRMWGAVEMSRPDILFFLGDNVYGDLGLRRGPKLLWRRYIRTRRALSVYHWKELIPVVATWDDHDFGLNDAGGAYGHKDDSVNAFHTFFAQEERDGVLTRGPGVSSIFHAFGQQFILADNRYYRRLPNRDGNLGFWGDQQVEFVFKNLQSIKGPVWMLQGSQVFGGDSKTKDTSFENHRFETEFNRVLENLRSLNVPVVFGSGDIHRSEILQIDRAHLGFPTVELTSSSMHSFPEFRKPYNSRVSHYIKGENFFVVDLHPSHSALRFDVTGIGRGEKVHFSDAFSVG